MCVIHIFEFWNAFLAYKFFNEMCSSLIKGEKGLTAAERMCLLTDDIDKNLDGL